MRILLTANASYDPPKGGSTRSNLIWLKHLASRGHQCRIVCAAIKDSARSHRDGIEIVSVANLPRHADALVHEIESFNPDWLLVSSEDLSHTLLRTADHAAPGRLIYLAHTPQWYPFGPASWHKDEHASDIVRGAANVVAIGDHMAAYIREYCGREAVVVHPPMYGSPPYPRLGHFDRGYVLMINPCAVKGLAIFLALAQRFPHLDFAGLEGWGTTSADRAAIERIPNCRLLHTVPNIDDALAQSRLLLMPSLWYEGFGLIAMEAMLRGLPVVSSDSGGLQEAKRHTGYIIPVQAIGRWQSEFDETHMPVPVVAPQEITPWEDALTELTTRRDAWTRESDRSRETALRFVEGLRVEAFEEMLFASGSNAIAAAAPSSAPSSHKLTPAQLALLAKRAREKR